MSNTHSILPHPGGRGEAGRSDGRTAGEKVERRTVTAISVNIGPKRAMSGSVAGHGSGRLPERRARRGRPTGVEAASPRDLVAAIYGPRPLDERSRRRPLPSSVYWRRRIVVLVVVAGAFLAGGKALEALGGGPLAAAEVRSSPSSAVAEHPAPPANRTSGAVRLVTTPVRRSTYVVQPGDTLWTIARSLQPEGDVRPLVDDLAAARDGRPLQPGERIELP